ncbi:MAG: hybrid sensor histidine kinase/response regulator [Comamonadaceae bacterium]|nr:hybrid sensor histidine kinase/response regulator [Comamonadaceae bacterium]
MELSLLSTSGVAVSLNPSVVADLLVVDDDGAELRALCDSLREEGFDTSCHAEPAHALDAMAQRSFDLLLTDLRMPGLDGISLLRHAREIDPDLGVIVLTGYGTVPSAVESLHLGAVDYVQKPITMAALLPVLRRSLQLRSMAREKSALEARERLRKAQLEAANRELELFGARVAHDLRQPVSIVRGFARMLADSLPGDSPPELTVYASHIVDAADRADRLVRDLLAFARMGNNPLVRTSVDLNAVLQRARDMVQLSNPARAAEWSVGPMPVVCGDASLLEQVFVNLFANAVKYSSDQDTSHIEVGYRLEPGVGHVVSVRDNGVGFNPAQSDQLFIPFQRLHSSSRFEGSGMGLANVKRIIERHGGSVRAKALESGGAEFSVVLPIEVDVTR